MYFSGTVRSVCGPKEPGSATTRGIMIRVLALCCTDVLGKEVSRDHVAGRPNAVSLPQPKHLSTFDIMMTQGWHRLLILIPGILGFISHVRPSVIWFTAQIYGFSLMSLFIRT